MKSIRVLFFSVAFALAGGSLHAWASCCDDAKKAHKECAHKCCHDAAKQKKSCEKCNPKPDKKEAVKK
jgi:hypothetical protein